MRARKRRAYLEYFHKNAAGEYVYAGDHYAYSGTDAERKRALTGLWSCLGAAAALMVLGGCIPVPGLARTWYILIPYVLSVMAVFMGLWSLGELTAGKDPLREYVYERSVKRLRRRSLEVSALAALSLIGELVFAVRTGGFSVSTGLFLGWEAAASLLSGVARLVLSAMHWEKQCAP